jgi:hypothetical protein
MISRGHIDTVPSLRFRQTRAAILAEEACGRSRRDHVARRCDESYRSQLLLVAIFLLRRSL